MNIGTPVESVAAALYACINNKEIMPDVKLVHRSVDQMIRPTLNDLKVYSFPQTWGSTALGFGGFGGAAMTTAQTVVVYCEQTDCAAVFWAGRHAYCIDNPPKSFWDDVKHHRIASLKNATEKYSKPDEETVTP